MVVPISQHYMMLQRNLLYGVTRARDVVVMVGDRRAIAMAVRNSQVSAQPGWPAAAAPATRARLGSRACCAHCLPPVLFRRTPP